MSESRTILLVDDEPGIVKMVGRRLEFEGYKVHLAMDGQEAMDKVVETMPSLVILDIMLPKLNGYEVCKWLKEDERFRKIPVILFTAMTQQKDKRFGFACGADAYLCKPFRTHELLDKVAELMPGGAGAVEKMSEKKEDVKGEVER